MREYKKREQSYPSDMTDTQWAEIEPLYSGLREYTWPKRELTDAVLYLVKTGCQWRHLPHDFPPYSTVHSFYRRARISGLWDKILQYLVIKTREDAGREEAKTVLRSFFGGSVKAMLSSFMAEGAISDKEAEELRQMIDKHGEG